MFLLFSLTSMGSMKNQTAVIAHDEVRVLIFLNIQLAFAKHNSSNKDTWQMRVFWVNPSKAYIKLASNSTLSLTSMKQPWFEKYQSKLGDLEKRRMKRLGFTNLQLFSNTKWKEKNVEVFFSIKNQWYQELNFCWSLIHNFEKKQITNSSNISPPTPHHTPHPLSLSLSHSLKHGQMHQCSPLIFYSQFAN